MGTLPFPPKKTGHNRPAHLAVEAILNGENGGLILLTHGSSRCFTEASFNCVNKFFLLMQRKNRQYTCFGSMERQLNVLETGKGIYHRQRLQNGKSDTVYSHEWLRDLLETFNCRTFSLCQQDQFYCERGENGASKDILIQRNVS